ncbi:hypothetical protein BH10PLA1_BH10PLA1_07010 [soil metagenome]
MQRGPEPVTETHLIMSIPLLYGPCSAGRWRRKRKQRNESVQYISAVSPDNKCGRGQPHICRHIVAAECIVGRACSCLIFCKPHRGGEQTNQREWNHHKKKRKNDFRTTGEVVSPPHSYDYVEQPQNANPKKNSTAAREKIHSCRPHVSNRRSASAVTLRLACPITSWRIFMEISPSLPVATLCRNGTVAARSQRYLMSAPL